MTRLTQDPKRSGIESPEELDSPPESIWRELPAICAQHDEVTLWIGPDANAQLILIQVLDWLRHFSGLSSRLWLRQSESPLGERCLADGMMPPSIIEAADLELATRAWEAFRASTPQAWAALSREPGLGRLPALHHAVHLLLDELPDGTGLGATERLLLRLSKPRSGFNQAPALRRARCEAEIHQAGPSFDQIARRATHCSNWMALSFSEASRLLRDFVVAPVPALVALTASGSSLRPSCRTTDFALRNSSMSLTEIGQRLVAGADDWSSHNPICRWWGGTRLTNSSLWRWDAADKRLRPPTRPDDGLESGTESQADPEGAVQSDERTSLEAALA